MRTMILGCGIALVASAATAQIAPSDGITISGPTQLFISPAGEPFRAAAGAPYPVAAWFAGADRDHDGKIDLGEFTIDYMRFFNRLDTDHDGMLSAAEITAYETDIAPEVAGREWTGGDRGFPGGGGPHGGRGGEHGRGGGGHGGGGGGGGGHGGGQGGMGRHGGGDGGGMGGGGMGGGGSDETPSSDGEAPASPAIGQSRDIASDLGGMMGGGSRFELIAIPEPVAAMDTSFSGHVSRADALAAAQRRFAMLDPDQKGSIAWADLPQTMAQQRAARGKR